MNNVADKLYNILGTKFDNTDIKTLDSKGKETSDMEEIEMFSFDFLVNSKNYGPVVILLSANDNLEVYYGDNTSKSLDRDAKKKWENLIEHLSTFARTNRLGFSLKHTSDLKYDLSNITDITESYKNIFEGYYGTRKTSYNKQGKAKIIIKHTRALGEDEKRFRNISSLFIENADGERFKLPFKKLTGARAMARHVTEGGNPYDLFGVHISEMVNDINTLGGFVRRSRMYEGNDEAMAMVETGRSHCNTMRKGLKTIAGKRGYHTYKESWEPSAITEQDTDVSTIRNMFMDNKVNQRTEDALPLLARLQKMAEARGEMDQAEKIGHEEDDMPFDWDRPEIKWQDHPEADDWERDAFGELDEARDGPSEEEIYRKIKDFSLVALKGYARAIKMPRDIVDQHSADEDFMIDEIMGYLFDDNWERVVMATGAFNEDVVTEQYEEQRTAILIDFLKKEGHRGSFDTLTLTSVLGEKGFGLEADSLEQLLLDMEKQGLVKKTGKSNLLGSGNFSYSTWKLVDNSMRNEMKELSEFEQWADNLVEGTWSFPDNPEALKELQSFMATEQPVGVDAMNATDALYNILGDDDLFDSLGELAESDPDGDARIVVKSYVEDMYRNLDQYAENDQANIVNLYKAVGGENVYPHEVDENADLDYDGNPAQLNASNNKDMDDYIQKEDVSADEYANSNVWNEAEELDEAALTFGVDGNGPYNVITSKGDIHDTYDSKDEALAVAKKLNNKQDESLNESVDLSALMQRTNFLLRK